MKGGVDLGVGYIPRWFPCLSLNHLIAKLIESWMHDLWIISPTIRQNDLSEYLHNLNIAQNLKTWAIFAKIV